MEETPKYSMNTQAMLRDIELMLIIESEDFKKKLEDIIEEGRDFDYEYNGEDEVKVEYFNTKNVIEAITKLLKTELLH